MWFQSLRIHDKLEKRKKIDEITYAKAHSGGNHIISITALSARPGFHCQMSPSNQKKNSGCPGCSKSKLIAQPSDVIVGVGESGTLRSDFFS